MLRVAALAGLAVLAWASAGHAQSAHSYDKLIATHASANGVPEALVHRVILRESRYNAGLVGRGGTIGLMQIKLATARGVGYSGSAEGLLDPNTNLTYAVKYLAGAYRTAGGDADRAVAYYTSGYYYAAKRMRASTQSVSTRSSIVARVSAANPGASSPNASQSPSSPCSPGLRRDPR